MPKKALDSLTESMFYVLMALLRGEKCGTEMAEYAEAKTKGRVRMGPGTLYTILGKFEEEKLIEETAVAGRKRTYRLTEAGRSLYREELDRLRQRLADAESEEQA